MRAPLEWLSEYCDPGWEPERIADRLAMTGTEVERVSTAGAPTTENFVLGHVLSVRQHPDADRLNVCEVETGDGPRTIVCGAANVAAGQMVAVALPGAVLPDGTKLKKATLRGVESDGMILSETELEIGEDAEGIMVLAEGTDMNGAGPGSPLADSLPISQAVLELEVTSNRPDCLAVYGVAREVHAVSGAKLAAPPWDEDAEATGEGKAEDYASVTVEVPELCPRFTARVFTDVQVGPSPAWLKARLTAAGQRPINNVVDITNYVMLLTGQPLHAFDLDEVPGGELIVRTANKGERMTTLDGVERAFDSDTVLVCDREGPSGIAGIMGGEASEVSERTSRVLMEVANWNGVNILRTSRRLGLRSEASARFEKQLHPALTMRAQGVASRLMVELAGAHLVPGTIDVSAGEPKPRVVDLRVPRVGALIGLPVDAETCTARLEALGFPVETAKGSGGGGAGATLRATVPPERDSDVRREADLIEEVARLGDLDQTLPSTLPQTPSVGKVTREQALRRRAEDVMRDLGATEIVGWSFADPVVGERLRLPEGDPRRDLIQVDNPLSGEQSGMRTTLLGSLLDAARLNRSRGADHVSLFESGRVHLRSDAGAGEGQDQAAGAVLGRHRAPVTEPHRIGLLASGRSPAGWREEPREPDFFWAKGILEALCAHLGASVSVEPADEPFLTPGRSAAIRLGAAGRAAGWIGEVHPLVARTWDLDGGSGFELDLDALIDSAGAGREAYQDVATFPPVHEDIAVVVSDELPAARVREAVIEAGGELLASAEVFDLYTGEQVGPGSKSLALRLAFRAPDRTLTDDEVAERRAAITDALGRIGGSLRG
ncbi:MAG: phenylalanyl-tRNA synthetase, beta subunit [Solirubrobacterales bacterium]|jgi:phenylalanyl-tRNA synthetase beta chain|nr:phenylalanyl-tRNA synthetase, beta subunit [Solirubrobacterales bacterium]